MFSAEFGLAVTSAVTLLGHVFGPAWKLLDNLAFVGRPWEMFGRFAANGHLDRFGWVYQSFRPGAAAEQPHVAADTAVRS